MMLQYVMLLDNMSMFQTLWIDARVPLVLQAMMSQRMVPKCRLQKIAMLRMSQHIITCDVFCGSEQHQLALHP